MKRHFGSDCCNSKTKKYYRYYHCLKCKKRCVLVRIKSFPQVIQDKSKLAKSKKV